MGYLVGAVCVSSLPEAQLEFCRAFPKTSYSANGCIQFYQACDAGASSVTLTRYTIATTAASGCTAGLAGTTASVHTPSFPLCDHLVKYTDMTALWGLGIASIAVLWALKRFILRQVTGNH